MPPSGDVGMYHECVGEGLKGKEARLRDGEKGEWRTLSRGCTCERHAENDISSK